MTGKQKIQAVVIGDGLAVKPGQVEHIVRRQHESNRTPLAARKEEAYGLLNSAKRSMEKLAGHGMVDVTLATSNLNDLRDKVQNATSTQDVRAVVSDIREAKKGFESVLKGKEFAQAGGLVEGPAE